jgi:phage repressor protein C with HTH and peptisase S24 domain
MIPIIRYKFRFAAAREQAHPCTRLDGNRRACAPLWPLAFRPRQTRRACPTSFNKSKRITGEGRPRWPTTESIAKVLEATGASFEDFTALVTSEARGRRGMAQPIPLIGLTQAGAGGFFDDGGFPVGQGWDQIRFPRVDDENAYALEVTGDSMQPLYRDGDILIVSPNSAARKGDRVVLRTIDGEVMAKILVRRTAKTIELASFNPAHPNLVFPVDRVDWMARIVWASQ